MQCNEVQYNTFRDGGISPRHLEDYGMIWSDHSVHPSSQIEFYTSRRRCQLEEDSAAQPPWPKPTTSWQGCLPPPLRQLQQSSRSSRGKASLNVLFNGKDFVLGRPEVAVRWATEGLESLESWRMVSVLSSGRQVTPPFLGQTVKLSGLDLTLHETLKRSHKKIDLDSQICISLGGSLRIWGLIWLPFPGHTVKGRLRRWYITIPSLVQWCTTIENHCYQWLSCPKTIRKPLIPIVGLNHSIQWWW